MSLRASAAFLVAFAVASVVKMGDARADDGQDACLSASEEARRLFGQKRLLDARARLRECVSLACASEVRAICEERLTDVAARLPTMIFDAKDEDGNDVARVRLIIDGAMRSEGPLDAEIALDPGVHDIRFETDGKPAVERRFVLVEFEKTRREHVVFGAPKSPPERAPVAAPGGDAPRATPLRTIGWLAIGAGAVGVGIGTAFGVTALVKNDDARCDDANVCDDPRSRHDARVAADNATVAFVAGAALIAGGAALLFLLPARTTAAVGPRSFVLQRSW